MSQGSVTSGILFNFYPKKPITQITNLTIGRELNGNKVNILCYADNIALPFPKENGFQYTFDTYAQKLECLSLIINTEKPYHYDLVS